MEDGVSNGESVKGRWGGVGRVRERIGRACYSEAETVKGGKANIVVLGEFSPGIVMANTH